MAEPRGYRALGPGRLQCGRGRARRGERVDGVASGAVPRERAGCVAVDAGRCEWGSAGPSGAPGGGSGVEDVGASRGRRGRRRGRLCVVRSRVFVGQREQLHAGDGVAGGGARALAGGCVACARRGAGGGGEVSQCRGDCGWEAVHVGLGPRRAVGTSRAEHSRFGGHPSEAGGESRGGRQGGQGGGVGQAPHAADDS